MEAKRSFDKAYPVLLLDLTVHEVQLKKSTKGKILLERVCDHLNLVERDFFGVVFRNAQGMECWIEPDKTLKKQVKKCKWEFEFRVKFYPPFPAQLQEDLTRYHVCLQVRRDIACGKLPCAAITYVLLGSYMVQSELGDFEAGRKGSNYLRELRFSPDDTQELRDMVATTHQQHVGMKPSEADLHYLENAKKLPLYGVDAYNAKDDEGNAIEVGVCSNGVYIFKEGVRVSRFAWPKVLRIQYRSSTFLLRMRPGTYEKCESTLGFNICDKRTTKLLWKRAVETHTFFRMKESAEPTRGAMFGVFRRSSRFRYSGRTAWQTRQYSCRPTGQEFDRSLSRRTLGSTRSVDGMKPQEVVEVDSKQSKIPSKGWIGSEAKNTSHDSRISMDQDTTPQSRSPYPPGSSSTHTLPSQQSHVPPAVHHASTLNREQFTSESSLGRISLTPTPRAPRSTLNAASNSREMPQQEVSNMNSSSRRGLRTLEM